MPAFASPAAPGAPSSSRWHSPPARHRARCCSAPSAWPTTSTRVRSPTAWGATATTATHFSPLRQIEYNEFAGISVAWALYQGKSDAQARDYFVGRYYKLASDIQFNDPLSLLRPSRNKLAAAL
ncbi:hypothetical protein PALA52_01217 [Pseudomonas aeruginosa]|nr:hypothetical protein PALA52_01217 [Pseudomonas aeruginosa]